jgi:hypothetical protein
MFLQNDRPCLRIPVQEAADQKGHYDERADNAGPDREPGQEGIHQLDAMAAE